jgi:excisionase family DNA binding protein
MKNEDRDEDMTTRQTAMRLRVSLNQVYALIWSGKLAAKREKDGWRIPVAAVNARITSLRSRMPV